MSKNPALLFHPNPPGDEGDLRRLFYNREIELENGLEILLSGAIPTLPLAVHGPTRSGKSHFARYLVMEAIATGARFEAFIVQASDKSTARRVLAKMYTSLLKSLPSFPEAFKTEDVLESWHRELKEFHDLLPLVEDPARQIEAEYSESEARQRSIKLGISLSPSVTFKSPAPTTGPVAEPRVEGRLEASRSSDQSRSQTQKLKWAIALPTDDHVVTLITQLLEFRRRVDDTRRVLFLVDDLDLLDPRLENGGECSVLLDRLGTLAASKRCTVVVTVRTQGARGRQYVDVGSGTACVDHLPDLRDSLEEVGRVKMLHLWVAGRRAYTLTVMALIVLSMGALGADCSRAAPACRDGGIGPTGCTGGQHRVCLNRCVTYVGSGAACTMDPCSTGSVCGPPYTCVPSSAGASTGTCQASVTTVGCNPTSGARCFEGSFCATTGTQAQVDAHTACRTPVSTQGNSPGICVTPARESETCDGNWSDTWSGSSSSICNPCEPGMQCVNNRCRRKCTADEDCPCPLAAGACQPPLPSGARVCLPCSPDGYSCAGTMGEPDVACCQSGAGSTCSGTARTRVCCRGSGKPCDINVPGQCCASSGLACRSGTCAACVANGSSATDTRECCDPTARIAGGVCTACVTGGNAASNASLCCPNLQWNGTICKAFCQVTLNTSCAVPSAVGQCQIGLVTSCDNTTGAPICTSVSAATTETCDTLDNDCDGLIDEGFQDNACSPATVFETVDGTPDNRCAAGNPPGHVIGGYTRCTRTGSVCVAVLNYDYCGICGPAGSGTNHGRSQIDCGGCGTTSGGDTCIPALCNPNAHCGAFGGVNRCYPSGCAHQWACWTAADVGTESCAP